MSDESRPPEPGTERDAGPPAGPGKGGRKASRKGAPSPPGLDAARRTVEELETALAADRAALEEGAGGEGDGEKGRRKEEKKKRKKGGKKAAAKRGRGVETMFRTSYRQHVDLSHLADNKANIMISINGIIISVLLASISPRIGAYPWLLLPTSVLLVGCLISMVFAILAARPRVSDEEVSLDQVRSGGANILFFGHFVNMDEEEYVRGMHELLDDEESLYENMVRDIYGLGLVLARKFSYLRVAYNVFMAGLVAGVVLFLLFYAFVSSAGPGLAP